MAGDAGNRLETTHQDTASYIKTLVLPRWLTLSFCPENIKKPISKPQQIMKKRSLGPSGTPRGGCLGATWAPRTKNHQKKRKREPPGTPFGIHWGSIFHHFSRKSNFLSFFSRRFSELVFLWILGGLGTSFFMIFSMIFDIF